MKRRWIVLLLLFMTIGAAGYGFTREEAQKVQKTSSLKIQAVYLECESEEDRKYGRGFYETVASDLNYKQRFIHSFKCVYMLKDYPIFKESDFEYLRGKIQRQTKRRFTYENCGYL